MADRKKILVFVVAYNAQKTLGDVINRIEVDQQDYDTHVLIIDDASGDSTFELGLQLESECKYPLTVFKNAAKLGYGGNLKLGYAYAIKNNYDVVALLHGDGRYQPETLSDLIEPILGGRADVVLGSRMLPAAGAENAGGPPMPLYKNAGNRVLSWLQNKILKQNLSEYHSGYRAYSTAMLRRLPFEYNTSDFHFDTEILIQLFAAGSRIEEVPIPSYSGDEVTLSNGFGYAWKVIRASLSYWLHQRSLFYRYNYDVPEPTGHYEFKPGYMSSHTMAIDAVDPGSTVFDIACSAGYVASYLKSNKQCTVYGIDQLEQSGEDLEEYFQLNLNQDELPEEVELADFVLLLDIIEHLADPEDFLYRLRSRVKAGSTRIVITTPNIAFLINRIMLLLGQFNYGKRGILDRTHTRLFTFSSLSRVLRQSGFEIHRMAGIPAPLPKATGDNLLGRLLLQLNRLAIFFSKRLFSYQIYAEVSALVTVDRLMENTENYSREATSTSERSRQRG